MTDAVSALSEWFEKQARVLPWRKTRDPYAIWISEVMLQQTQVTTVIPYYHRFLEKFPTVQKLAHSREEEVLQLWSGLGYYSRAKNLRKAARFLTENFRGSFPRDREAVLDIPGIGPYTAGAVLSIAFDLPEPLVDGNVQRVFARYFGMLDPIESTVAKTFFWERAAEWVKASRSPRILNQALMELGAMVCTKGKPACSTCPLQTNCVALRNNWQEELPRRKPRREIVELWWVAAVIEHQGKVLLQQNAPGTWWADLWDFPHFEVDHADKVKPRASQMARQLKSVRNWEKLPIQKHTVTHHRLRVAPFVFRVDKREAFDDEELRAWVPLEKASKAALSGLARKILEAYLALHSTVLQ